MMILLMREGRDDVSGLPSCQVSTTYEVLHCAVDGLTAGHDMVFIVAGLAHNEHEMEAAKPEPGRYW